MQQQVYDEDIKRAIEVMKRGGIILYPTDTVWGIGCDATNEDAVKKIYALKQRADTKSMLCLVDDMDSVFQIVKEVPDIAYDLNNLAIRPITIIYSNAFNLAPSMLNENHTIGIRVTKEVFSRDLCRRFGKPIVSTSANISGEPTPCFFSAIKDTIKNGVDYIVSYRQKDETQTQPSQIIQLGPHGEVKVIRE